MIRTLVKVSESIHFVGPHRQPKRWDQPEQPPQKLLSRDFILLFLMAMCSNSYIAVYYSFEQWMQELGIAPSWRGVLLSSLFAMILLFRPLTSMIMLKRSKLAPMAISLGVATGVMLIYPLVTPGNAIPVILALRLIQGVALAVYSTCTIGVLVDCIPPGQSARGFALFSLTMLLPYSIIPGISEELLPMLGGVANLFATMAWLGLPSFIMLFLLAKRLRKPEISGQQAATMNRQAFLTSILHSGLALVYMACLTFSIATILAIFFMKGLCGITGEKPAQFFTFYSLTIILVRVFGSHLMDTLPRHKVTIICSIVLAFCMLGISWGIPYTFVALSCVYGFSLGLLYPLLAAAVYDRSTPETRSVNSNMMMAAFDASGMLAPILGGFVIEAGYGYRGVFVTAAITVMICGICMFLDGLRMRAKGRKPR